MHAPAIRVEKLAKRYRIGAPGSGERSLRSAVSRFLSPSRRREQKKAEEFWALQDVSFEISPGGTVGVIGRNGAGKSTLLKILSHITPPTKGLIALRGRVASLLEVGTGFHPELTGRENIYLNGAILGMSRWEVAAKFDAIVAFAEVQNFLDTPVKRYSSGMYVRLAFAVAAHLEPEILLVDEVLAVGDSAFQSKCLGKMRDVSRDEGRTVVFVSHSMAAISALCETGIVLEQGRVAYAGPTHDAIGRYLRRAASTGLPTSIPPNTPRGGTGEARFEAFWLENATGQETQIAANGRPCRLAARVGVGASGAPPLTGIEVTFTVRSFLGTTVFYHQNVLTGRAHDVLEGTTNFRLHLERLPLPAGRYAVDLYLSRDRGNSLIDVLEGLLSIEVCDGDFFRTGATYTGGPNAALMVEGYWTAETLSEGPRVPNPHATV